MDRGEWSLGFLLGLHFGPSSPDVPRLVAERHSLWSQLRTVDTSQLGSHAPGLFERDGGFADSQTRGEEGETRSTCQGGRPRISIAEASAPISQKAKSRCRGLGFLDDPKASQKSPITSHGVSSRPAEEFGGEAHPTMHVPGRQSQLGFDFELSFDTWCSHLTVNCLRSRTPFQNSLQESMKPCCSRSAANSTLFPLPVPFENAFDRMARGVSSRVRRRIHFQRAMHCVVMALNFWHCGGDFSSLDLIHRTPSAVHLSIFGRIRSMLRADGQFPKFRVIGAGRRFPQLVARLREATDFVTLSGVASEPYSKQFAGTEIPFDNSALPELEPYRDADPERIKLKGRGHWDITDFLPDSLCMPYREPMVIFEDRLPEPWEYPKIKETPLQIAKIAKVWDINGLLFLHDREVPRHHWVRVFGCLKDAAHDRQIGDRRGRNACELKVDGPSAELPAGSDLCDLMMDLDRHRLHISVTDRSDFYHQVAVSPSRAMSNSLGPFCDAAMVADTHAFAEYKTSSQKVCRIHHGDGLFLGAPPQKTKPGLLVAAFDSILQGDHAGVEFACAAHSQLLRNYGLLDAECSVVGSGPVVAARDFQGLVIDDFFAISVEPKSDGRMSRSVKAFNTAQRAYHDFSLIGSPDKDVKGATRAKVIGAEVAADEVALSCKCPSVSAPAQKRFGLSWISFQIAQLSHTTDSLHLSLLGGWTSVLMFRRPFMSILQEAFHLVPSIEVSDKHAKLVPLPRRVATELVLLACLAPLIKTDISAPFCEKLFATDASSDRGAVVSTKVPEDLYAAVFRCCKSKGSYTRLLSKDESLLSQLGFGSGPVDFGRSSVPKPLAFRFVFLYRDICWLCQKSPVMLPSLGTQLALL